MDKQSVPGRSDQAKPTPGEPKRSSSSSEPGGLPSNGWRLRPQWLGQFIGREVLRVCPEAAKEDPCEGCALRVFCKCAQADWEAACRVERRVWMVIVACSAAVVLYAIFR